jgi:1-acyl-sn-glycerol-3-phosphate acyltransferase
VPNWTWYRAGRLVTRFILACTMRTRTLRPHIPSLPGGYILALSHQGHVDPFVASTLQSRPVVWMTRKEFFKYAPARFAIRKLNGFCVDRQGTPVSSIRHAIRMARDGNVVGICPEGGVVAGPDACFRGGRIKRGVASVSLHSGAPIIPCLILGTARLNKVAPWLPAKRGRLWIAYANPLHPPPNTRSTKHSRDALARQLESAYATLYTEMSRDLNVDQSWVA